MVFFFRSEFFFRTTQELEYFLLLSREAQFFFQNLTLGYTCMTKTLNQIFFSLHQNQNIFFSNIGNKNIFLEKKPNRLPFFILYHYFLSSSTALIYVQIRNLNLYLPMLY